MEIPTFCHVFGFQDIGSKISLSHQQAVLKSSIPPGWVTGLWEMPLDSAPPLISVTSVKLSRGSKMSIKRWSGPDLYVFLPPGAATALWLHAGQLGARKATGAWGPVPVPGLKQTWHQTPNRHHNWRVKAFKEGKNHKIQQPVSKQIQSIALEIQERFSAIFNCWLAHLCCQVNYFYNCYMKNRLCYSPVMTKPRLDMNAFHISSDHLQGKSYWERPIQKQIKKQRHFSTRKDTCLCIYVEKC